MSRSASGRYRLDLGLTARGSALLTAGLTALVCGIALGQRDLVRVAVLLAAAPVVASIVVGRSRLSVACSRSVQPARVNPGVAVIVRIGLRNEALLPTGSLMLEDNLHQPFQQRARFSLDSIRGREQRSLAYQLPRVGRGAYRVGPLKMRLTDPFGLVERTRAFQTTSDVVVLPQIDELAEQSLPGGWDSARQAGSHSVGSHGSDDASIRDYRYGDDLRKVHWRSTARLGSMMVRQEEQPWHGRMTLLLDARAVAHRRSAPHTEQQPDPRRTDSFEWAVSATASIATHLLNRGRALDVVVGTTRIGAARQPTLMDQLATLRPENSGTARQALDAADVNGRESTVIAVFGDLDAATSRSIAARHRSSGTAYALLLDVGTWSAASPPGGATQSMAVDATRSQALRQTEATLVGAGWRICRVDAAMTVADAWAALVRRSYASTGRGPAGDNTTIDQEPAVGVRP